MVVGCNVFVVGIIGRFYLTLHQSVNLDGTKYDNIEPQRRIEASRASTKKYTEGDDPHVAKI